MSDLIDDPDPGLNAPEFTVSEISGVVKRMIEGEFSHVRIRGEVGRVSRPASGHLYLDLKDDRAVLASVIWKGTATRLRTMPEEGMEVIATGRLTTFPGQSRYQMVIEDIAPAGLGALMLMLEKRKKALEAEGLFAPDKKRPLPYLPAVIGVVTSPSGAVIRDILHRLRDRFPRQVLIWPVAVQGEKCAAEVAAAINGFNQLPPDGAIPRPDLLIVARGGGSIEDLWGFNEEVVVRAAAASQIPLISAVGHETDTTLIDYASDQRAPTPTAAAELAVPVRADLLAYLSGLEERRLRGLAQVLQIRRQRLRDLARALPRPSDLVDNQSQRLDAAVARLKPALRFQVQFNGQRLAKAENRLPAALRHRVQLQRQRLTETSSGLRPANLRRGVLHKSERLQQFKTRFSQTALRFGKAEQDQLAAQARLLTGLSYKGTLARGYAVVRDQDNVVITNVAAGEAALALNIQFKDGVLDVGAPTRPASKSTRPKPGGGDQGSLF